MIEYLSWFIITLLRILILNSNANITNLNIDVGYSEILKALNIDVGYNTQGFTVH